MTTTPAQAPSRLRVAGRRVGWALAVVHAALLLWVIPYTPSGPPLDWRKETFVWDFVLLDLPISIPTSAVFDMGLGLYQSAPLLLWFIYLVVGTLWQFYWPRGLARLLTRRKPDPRPNRPPE